MPAGAALLCLLQILMAVCALFVGDIAREKGRSFGLWYLFALVSFTLALFYVVLVDDLNDEPLLRRMLRGRPPLVCREWFQLRGVTWVLLLTAATLLIFANLPTEGGGLGQCGWPSPWINNRGGWSWRGLLADVNLAYLILVAIGVLSENVLGPRNSAKAR